MIKVIGVGVLTKPTRLPVIAVFVSKFLIEFLIEKKSL